MGGEQFPLILKKSLSKLLASWKLYNSCSTVIIFIIIIILAECDMIFFLCMIKIAALKKTSTLQTKAISS